MTKKTNFFALLRLKEYKRQWLYVGGISLLAAYVELLPIQLITALIDQAQRGLSSIIINGLVLILVYILSSLLQSWLHYYVDLVSARISKEVRYNVVEATLEISYGDFITGQTDGMETIFEDAKIIGENSIKPFFILLQSVMLFIMAIVYITQIHPLATVFLFAVAAISFFLTKKMSNSFSEKVFSLRKSEDEILELLLAIKNFFADIKSNRLEAFFAQKGLKESEKLFCEEKKTIKSENYISCANRLIFMVTIGILFILTAILAYLGWISIGALVALMMYNSVLTDPLMNVADVIKKITKVEVSSGRINLIKQKTKPLINSLQEEIESISFDHVTYVQKGKEILRDITFTISKGEKVAFVGKSGAGKSTILRLIAGLIDATQGYVIVNGRKQTPAAYSDKMGFLWQEAQKPPKDTRTNLELIPGDIDLIHVEQLGKKLGISHLLSSDRKNIEKLSGISGGEQKRLAVLRMLAKKEANWLLLDELSNSLDGEKAKSIFKMIKEKENQTLIAVDHRIHLVKDFDKIYFIDKGKIKASGNHQWLVNHCEKYAVLYGKSLK